MTSLDEAFAKLLIGIKLFIVRSDEYIWVDDESNDAWRHRAAWNKRALLQSIFYDALFDATKTRIK